MSVRIRGVVTSEKTQEFGQSRGHREGRPQQGSGTVLVAAVMLVLMVLAGGLLVVAGYVAAVHHARAAADLAALSGAAAQARGQDACRVANGMAWENRVRLAACHVRGDSLDFVVSVSVAQPVPNPGPLLPGVVSASATAGRLGLL